MKNVLLNIIGAELRKSRPEVSREYTFFNRTEPSKGKNYVEVWFRTRGCRHDYQGGCTMCNYGVGDIVHPRAMVSYVYDALKAIDVPVYELLISPSGNMLDSWEVPDEARSQIYKLVSNFPCDTFLIETRAETIDAKRVEQLVSQVPEKTLGIEIGLESAVPWILKYCVNKDMSLEEYSSAIKILAEHNVRSYANVSLGTAFLSEAEAIKDAVFTTNWAFEQGTDVCVVFPLHVKPYTLLHWLWENNMYTPISLWSLVEVLKLLGPDLCSKTEISWYKSYFGEEHSNEKWISASPTTCPECIDQVMPLLDQYRDMQSYETVLELDSYSCECHDRWRKQISFFSSNGIQERVARIYDEIPLNIFGIDWWSKNKEHLVSDILSSRHEVPDFSISMLVPR